jgi:hypothetical protein
MTCEAAGADALPSACFKLDLSSRAMDGVRGAGMWGLKGTKGVEGGAVCSLEVTVGLMNIV